MYYSTEIHANGKIEDLVTWHNESSEFSARWKPRQSFNLAAELFLKNLISYSTKMCFEFDSLPTKLFKGKLRTLWNSLKTNLPIFFGPYISSYTKSRSKTVLVLVKLTFNWGKRPNQSSCKVKHGAETAPLTVSHDRQKLEVSKHTSNLFSLFHYEP